MVGLSVLSSGIYLLVRSNDYADVFETPIAAASVVTTTGALISVVAFFGCFGASRDEKCMLYTVSFFL